MKSRCPVNNKKISGNLPSLISTDYSECLQLARPPDNTLHRSTIPDGVKGLKRVVKSMVE